MSRHQPEPNFCKCIIRSLRKRDQILFTSAGVEVAPPVVTTVEATAGVVTDETVCVGAGCVVADCDTTTGAVAISGPGKAFAETTCGVPDDPVWRLSLSCPSSIKF